VISFNIECSEGDMVLMDSGAEYHGYSSDITRVWPVNGVFTEGQMTIYDLVLGVNKKCIEVIIQQIAHDDSW